MASACVNNISMSPEGFPTTTYGWFSPRVSLSREFPNDDGFSAKVAVPKPQPLQSVAESRKLPDPEPSAGEFEFRLEDRVAMLPADELFSDGKLVPLQISSLRPSAGASVYQGSGSPGAEKYRRRDAMPSVDPYLISPKAPRCSSRWRELIGLKKLYQNSTSTTNQNNSESTKTSSSSSVSASSSQSTRSLKNFLHRSTKSSSSSSCDAYLSLPLLKDSDCESVSISSSRLSLSSSSSSGQEHEELPRLSLDSDKTAPNPFKAPKSRTRLVSTSSGRAGRSSSRAAAESSRGVSVDSPRMNSSGKIVFQSLERSSSSPSRLNGLKHRGMERSYSANVRVLNVPVSSLRGSSKSGSVFGFFSAPQKRDAPTSTRRLHQHNTNTVRNRIDRS